MASVVLVEPEIPENTGFIARLTANFGFDLRIVKPRFNLAESRGTASSAQEKLRDARIFDSVEDAVEDLDYIVGTKPGRGKSLGEFQPRENTSIMIGRESSGLSNKELDLCDAVVHIETGEYSSLNQSHAASILMHSFFSREESRGMSEGVKNKLHSMIGGTTLEKAIIESNPSTDVMGRIISDLRQLKQK
ncbi:MAG: RNA methyltransferase [Candidatus Aenigmatarchaeota archaeon]